MEVWLVTLMQSFGNTLWADARNLKLMTVLNGRLGEKRVSSLVEFIHANEVYSLRELLENVRPNPKDKVHAVKVGRGIICGENPFVFARKVDVVDIRMENGIEKLIWKEGGVVRAIRKKVSGPI
ncbi:MAG: hypothetical protein ACLFQR_08620 [Desulfovibrionales bacterium]